MAPTKDFQVARLVIQVVTAILLMVEVVIAIVALGK
jgi:hypothetical protein